MPTRHWKDAVKKVKSESALHGCRLCGGRKKIETAHILGRRFDEKAADLGIVVPEKLYVHPDSCIPLCRECHGRFDANEIGVLEELTPREIAWCILRCVSFLDFVRKVDKPMFDRLVREEA